jgi:hypothetical protein
MINMVPTIMILHQWQRINGMIQKEVNVYSTLKPVRVNDPLLATSQKSVVAKVTT